MSLTKYKAMSKELSAQLQEEAENETLSHQEMIKTLRAVIPRTPNIDKIIIFLVDRLEDINGDGGYVTINMNQKVYQKFLASQNGK